MKISTPGTGCGDPAPTRFNTATLPETGANGYLFDAGGAGFGPADPARIFHSKRFSRGRFSIVELCERFGCSRTRLVGY